MERGLGGRSWGSPVRLPPGASDPLHLPCIPFLFPCLKTFPPPSREGGGGSVRGQCPFFLDPLRSGPHLPSGKGSPSESRSVSVCRSPWVDRGPCAGELSRGEGPLGGVGGVWVCPCGVPVGPCAPRRLCVGSVSKCCGRASLRACQRVNRFLCSQGVGVLRPPRVLCCARSCTYTSVCACVFRRLGCAALGAGVPSM